VASHIKLTKRKYTERKFVLLAVRCSVSITPRWRTQKPREVRQLPLLCNSPREDGTTAELGTHAPGRESESSSTVAVTYDQHRI
jgi:hypothetical protein